jgi:hemerythrin superfamily protein
MDDIYEYIKADHKKVAHLFEQFEKEKSSDIKVEIVTMIVKELLLHSHSEQETFYKKLEEYPASREDAEHGEEEHKEIEDQINVVVAGCATPNKAWETKVLELKKIVDDHVKEEEGEIFSKAKQVLDEDEALRLKEQMHTYKTRILQNAALDSI